MQTASRERWIRELAKKAGITNTYYREWTYSHQTRGDSLSAITVINVAQPWQRSRLFDYTKKNADKLQEKFYIRDREEHDWNRIIEEFGTYQGPPTSTTKQLKVQPQTSLWDRVTGLPLKIAMSVLELSKIEFRHGWRDLTLTHKDSGEYLIWIQYAPDHCTVTIHMSEKNIPDPKAFASTYEVKFNDILNGGNKAKAKGKGKGGLASSSQDKDASLPMTHSSHARCSKFPFALNASIISDKTNHWDAWKNAWTQACHRANSRFAVKTL